MKRVSGLVLGRKEGESITVDGPAEIIIEKVRGNRVSVRIVAAETTKIKRKELGEKCKP